VLGVPYSDADIAGAVEHATAQARQIAGEIATQGGPEGLEDTKVVALIAYLQRLGTDIKRPEPAAQPATPQAEPTAAANALQVAEAR
jgi:cytochrome c oxidase cbb3-type subunit I/II